MRALFGVAMGGEWGIGSALTMETIPPSARGFVSGLLQAGYPSGYFLASLAVYLFYDRLGWRYMFALGVIPAFLVYFIRRGIDESPAWTERIHAPRTGLFAVLGREWKLAVYAVILMTALNFFSHGSQDAYPNLFLKVQHRLRPPGWVLSSRRSPISEQSAEGYSSDSCPKGSGDGGPF